ncbi:MAG: DNA polymerase III subunit delta' [Peptococcaceae bacterium]|nr:DNA polymerase III subunit delta' [Peptococcaceae bacterium]
MRFSDIPGQSIARRYLGRILQQGRVAQAYIFTGPQGVGKEALATAFGRALLCLNPDGDGACGQCEGCRKVQAGMHPDHHFINGNEGRIGIAAVRDLQRKIQFRPFYFRHVCVMTGAENLTTEAGNALLKTLEEPNTEVVFVLITSYWDRVLPTILSRCIRVSCHLLSRDEITGALERMGYEREKAQVAAAMADGSLDRARALLEGEQERLAREELLQLVFRLDHAGAAELWDVLQKVDTGQNLEKKLSLLALWYRDLLLWRETGNQRLLVNVDRLETIKKQAFKRTPAEWMQKIAQIEDARKKLRFNANPRLVADMLLLRLAGYGSEE